MAKRRKQTEAAATHRANGAIGPQAMSPKDFRILQLKGVIVDCQIQIEQLQGIARQAIAEIGQLQGGAPPQAEKQNPEGVERPTAASARKEAMPT